jgi:hypothetical protein
LPTFTAPSFGELETKLPLLVVPLAALLGARQVLQSRKAKQEEIEFEIKQDIRKKRAEKEKELSVQETIATVSFLFSCTLFRVFLP